MDWGWSWWWMVPMMFVMVAVVCAVVLLVVASTRSSDTPPKSQGLTPEDILNERFARGEIDAAEYRERMDTLRKTEPARR